MTDGLTMPLPGSRRFVAAIVTAQVLTQIGAFTLPALLPGYIDRWHLSKTEAGWLVGVFFAAYVPAVPVLLALTERLPTRRVYLFGTGLTALSQLGFALLADGFWSGLLMRAIAGVGWAGAYMPGLKAIADPLEGTDQSRAVSWHAASVGIAGALSPACSTRSPAQRRRSCSGRLPQRSPSLSPSQSWRAGPCVGPRRPPPVRCSTSGQSSATGRPWLKSPATPSTHGNWPPCVPGPSPF